VGPFARAIGLGERKRPSSTSEFWKILVEPLSDARTPLTDFFSILLEIPHGSVDIESRASQYKIF